MKKITGAEFLLLIVIPCLTVWVGASSWHAFKKRSVSVENTTANVTKLTVRGQAKVSVKKQADIVRSLADDPASYLNELRQFPALAPLANDQSVQMFVNYVGRDFSQAFMNNQVGVVEELANAARQLVPKLTDFCLENKVKCEASDPSAGYSLDSSSPLQTILTSALECLRNYESYSPSSNKALPTDELMKDFAIGQNNVQIEASEILADRNLGDAVMNNVLTASANIKGPAKVEFLRIFGPLTSKRAPNVRLAYLAALSKTLSNRNDLWTAEQVFLNLQQFQLSQPEFQGAASNSCTIDFGGDSENSRKYLQTAIQDNARRSGYDIDFGPAGLCWGAGRR